MPALLDNDLIALKCIEVENEVLQFQAPAIYQAAEEANRVFRAVLGLDPSEQVASLAYVMHIIVCGQLGTKAAFEIVKAATANTDEVISDGSLQN